MEAHIARTQRPLHGRVLVPSDKSISHRAVLFAAMAEGTSDLKGVLDSADVRSTMSAVSALGARVDTVSAEAGGLHLRVTGWGRRGPSAPAGPIDCGNSGTTVRMLMGVLAGWPVVVTLTGDESLSRRPMERVAEPLRSMGADVRTSGSGTLPLTVRGGGLRAVEFDSPVASAQVKSAVLLAGLCAEGVTTVREPALSRDHTERLLPAFGVTVQTDRVRNAASVCGPAGLLAADISIPADPSSAAFIAVAAAIVSGSEVTLPGVSLNPTRTGFLRVLERMGARVRACAEREMGAEPVADLEIVYVPGLVSTTVTAVEVPSLIDEVPILALAATQANGVTRFESVGELRVKESDRLDAVCAGLAAFGADVRSGDDWLVVTGPTPLRGTRLESEGDHRLAMTWAIAGLIAEGQTEVTGFESVDVSYPGFGGDLDGLRSG